MWASLFVESKWVYRIILVAIFLFYLFTRLFLFTHEGAAAFGYDTGIYRHLIDGYYEKIHDKSVVPFGFASYSNFLKILHVSTDDVLLSWYILFSVLLFFLFYLFVKTYVDSKTALIAVFLFSISLVQYEFYWWFYYRSFLALNFVFLAFILFRYRSYLAVFPLIAIGTVHVLTLIPLGLTMLGLVILEKENRKYFFITGFIALCGVLVLNFREFAIYLPHIVQTGARVSNLNSGQSEFSGQFIDFTFFWKHTFLYLIFGFIGWFSFFKKYSIVSLLFIFSLLPIIFSILFYRRFFVFVDICLIFFAAVFLKNIFDIKKQRLCVGVFLFFAGMGIFLTSNFVLEKQPLISHVDLENIVQLNMIPSAQVISISSATAPWLYGFTHHRIIAPGIFEENKWNQNQWQVFWTSPYQNERHELLKQYELPLFVYVGPFERGFSGILTGDSNFVQRSQFLWEYKP